MLILMTQFNYDYTLDWLGWNSSKQLELQSPNQKQNLSESISNDRSSQTSLRKSIKLKKTQPFFVNFYEKDFTVGK